MSKDKTLDSDKTPVVVNDGSEENKDTLGRDTSGAATATQPDLGEKLAQEAVEKSDMHGNVGTMEKVFSDPATGKEVKDVKAEDEGNYAVSFVNRPQEDLSDNGKTYSDPRIVPSDTNAPDAGLTPDGRRIAE